MTYRPRASCKQCGVGRALAGGLSYSGLCSACGEANLAGALRDLASKSGPVWDRYVDGVIEYAARLGGQRIPDVPPSDPFQQDSLFEVSAL